MSEFQMLLVLGFPPETAAAIVMPNVFTVGEKSDFASVRALTRN